MANMIVQDGKYVLSQEVEAAGILSKTLNTQNKFIDKNIDIIVSTPAGALSAGATTVGATDAENILSEVSSAPSSGEYITITGQGSVSVGTAGFLDAGTSQNTTSATKYYTLQNATFTVDGPNFKSVNKGYVAAGQTLGTVNPGVQAVTGGALSEGAKSSDIASDGYYNGTSYDGTDKIKFESAETSGVYKITGSGSATVNRAVVNKQVTTAGYFAADTSAVSQISASSLTVNVPDTAKYIKKSTLSTDSVISSNVAQTITVTEGYCPSDRTITVAPMVEKTPTTSLADTGMSTYFNSGTSSSKDVTITPQYSNEAGYVSAHTNTNNGGVKYYKIKTQTVTETATTVSGTTATRGTRTESVGWKATAETITAAAFGNAAATGKTGSSYVDISGTTAAPVLVSGDYLYINKGWTDDVKISLAKLVPDGSDVKGHNEYILSGHSAYDDDGNLVAGSIPTYDGSYTVN